MVLVVRNWKQKLIKVLSLLLIIALFTAAAPALSGILYEKVPVFNGWFEDEHPSGNPMRVEKEDTSVVNQKIDGLVMKVQNFYYEERE